MGKNIALFFDGTWNTRASNTNVSRLYELTESERAFRGRFLRKPKLESGSMTDEVKQVKYYHEGVGVRWSEKILGGMFGYGLSRNIREGYLWLSEQYEEGDEIFIFGFSRGAYTARSLVGLIRKCGILKTPTDALSREAYKIYREKKWHPDSREPEAFRKTFSWQGKSAPSGKAGVKFIGVWDTVGALGIPLHGIWFGSDYYNWHDTELSKIVKNAYHALALDEHRSNFAATMWSKPIKSKLGQYVEQRWFAGSHADIGGGYRDNRLSAIALRWMQENAIECGLKFSRNIVVDADAYLAKMHNSYGSFLGGLYKKIRSIFPYHRPLFLGFSEKIDKTVWQRVNDSLGKDEKGRKYSPPALQNLKPGTIDVK